MLPRDDLKRMPQLLTDRLLLSRQQRHTEACCGAVSSLRHMAATLIRVCQTAGVRLQETRHHRDLCSFSILPWCACAPLYGRPPISTQAHYSGFYVQRPGTQPGHGGCVPSTHSSGSRDCLAATDWSSHRSLAPATHAGTGFVPPDASNRHATSTMRSCGGWWWSTPAAVATDSVDRLLEPDEVALLE